MNDVVKINLLQFFLVYLLLIVVLLIMKKSKINQTRLLLVASLRMSVQLALAGFILTYIFQNPHPAFTVACLLGMAGFAINRVLSQYPTLNRRFKLVVALSLGLSGLCMIAFFVVVVVGVNLFNPQYAIPIGGMVIGNAMTGVNLGLKVFLEGLTAQRQKVAVLLNFGAEPREILLPFANNALETALLPTLNSMLGMGIVSLPGMMTGQILSGTLPATAIMYQIAIMITICAVCCLAVFSSLYLGYKTLYNKRNQMLLP